MIDPAEAASRLFPDATPATPPVATPAPPRAPAPAPATQATAPAEDSDAANMAKLERLFGAKPANDDGTTVKPAEGAQKPADGDPAKTEAAPVFDPVSPETAIVAPVAAELGLTAAQVTKLTELRSALQDRQAQAWHSEASKTLDASTIREAQRAMAYAPPGLRSWLNESGVGNHPGLLTWAANMMRRTPAR